MSLTILGCTVNCRFRFADCPLIHCATDHLVNAINDRYDSPDFITYLQAEQLIMKCVKSQDYGTEYEAVTNFYGIIFTRKI